jgi:hypothetical protein
MSDATTPEWERFGRAIMAGWPACCTWDDFEIQDLAHKCGLLRKEQYDPLKHGYEAADEYDVRPGDDWFILTYKRGEND